MTHDPSKRLVAGCCAVVIAAACSKSSDTAMPTGTEPVRVTHKGHGRPVLQWQSPSTHGKATLSDAGAPVVTRHDIVLPLRTGMLVQLVLEVTHGESEERHPTGEVARRQLPRAVVVEQFGEPTVEVKGECRGLNGPYEDPPGMLMATCTLSVKGNPPFDVAVWGDGKLADEHIRSEKRTVDLMLWPTFENAP